MNLLSNPKLGVLLNAAENGDTSTLSHIARPEFLGAWMHSEKPETATSPLITVIVPVYNRASIIGKAIESVLQQNISDFELIVVDDYSDDYEQLQSLLRGYEDARIKLIRHAQNLNGAAARNTGISAAAGRYIALLDSDDIWHPDKLHKCLERHYDPRDVIYSKLICDKDVLPARAKGTDESVGDYLIIHHGSMQTSTLFMSTDLAREVMFDDALYRFQDYDFVIRLEEAGVNFIFIEEALVEMLNDDRANRLSYQTDFSPAVFWLNRTRGLSKQAQAHFYLTRIARLMAISGKNDRIFEFMPASVRQQLSGFQLLYLHVLELLPRKLVPALRSLYQSLK